MGPCAFVKYARAYPSLGRGAVTDLDPPAWAIGTPAAGAVPDARTVVKLGILGKGAEFMSQAGLMLVAPRVLVPRDYGTFALALAVVGLVSTSLTLGGATIVSRFVPAAAPHERAGVARALTVRLGWWRAIKLASLALVAVAMIVLAPERFPAGLTLLVLAALAVDTVAALGFQIALALGHTGVWSARWAIQNSLLTVALVVGYTAWGVHGAVAAITVSSGCMLAWTVALLGRRLMAAPRGAPLPERLLRFATLQGVGSLLSLVVMRGGVVAVALLAASKTQTAYAALAFGVAAAIVFAVSQVFTIQLPGLVATGRLAEAEAEAGRLANQMVAPLALLAGAGVLALEPAIPLVFGHGYDGARDALAIALGTIPLAPLAALATQVSALRLRPGARTAAAAAGIATFAAVGALAVPAHGAAGASVALVAASAATVLTAGRCLPGALGARTIGSGLLGAALVVALALAVQI
jgi:O-antigen/teichoic acid export membrane protein